MFILAIDTSSEVSSLGISSEDGPLASIQWSRGISSSKNLTGFTKLLLEKIGLKINDIDALAISSGPGSFTGLRVGLAFAKGLAWSLSKPLFAVNTLEAMASRGFGAQYISPALSAKKGLVFCALFECKRGTIKRLEPDISMEPMRWAEFLKERCDSKAVILGNGANLYREVWNSTDAIVANESICYDLSGEVAKIGIELYKKGLRPSAISVEPNYVRPSDAKLPKRRR